jgi:hypothetical protein
MLGYGDHEKIFEIMNEYHLARMAELGELPQNNSSY